MRIGVWVRSNMGTTIKYAIAALTVAFTLGGYVVTARATDADHEARIRRLESMAEDTAFNAWAGCVANKDKLAALGIQCRDVRGK
jgi:hypothetical protein